VRVAMTYLRLAEAEGGSDPHVVARSVFRSRGWRDRYPVLSVAGAWQGLHYLLTGDPWDGPHPAADVVCGGRLLTEDGTDEFGIDVIYLSPQRVKVAADHLTATKFGDIAGRYDAARMAQLGVQGAKEWATRPTRDVRDGELRAAYEHLTGFFKAASGAGEAIYKAMG
jgi:hypothetical protein